MKMVIQIETDEIGFKTLFEALTLEPEDAALIMRMENWEKLSPYARKICKARCALKFIPDGFAQEVKQ